jgi:hypothetical protein
LDGNRIFIQALAGGDLAAQDHALDLLAYDRCQRSCPFRTGTASAFTVAPLNCRQFIHKLEQYVEDCQQMALSYSRRQEAHDGKRSLKKVGQGDRSKLVAAFLALELFVRMICVNEMRN